MACNKKPCNSNLLRCTSNTCQKVCIDVDKIYDICKQQISIPATINITFSSPPTNGYTITSLTNSAQGYISNLEVTAIPDNPCSRVRYTLTVPIVVVATNNFGHQITGIDNMVINQDIILMVPADAVVAPEIAAVVSIVGANNQIINETTVTTEACVTIITKSVAKVVLVVPSYGHPKIRDCQVYIEDLCSGVFESTDIFPR